MLALRSGESESAFALNALADEYHVSAASAHFSDFETVKSCGFAQWRSRMPDQWP